MSPLFSTALQLPNLSALGNGGETSMAQFLTVHSIYCAFSYQDGGQVEFSDNPRAPPFNEDLLSDSTFSQIHFEGQYPLRAL
jgi:hypothetical protein